MGESFARHLSRSGAPYQSIESGDVVANRLGGRAEVFAGSEMQVWCDGVVKRGDQWKDRTAVSPQPLEKVMRRGVRMQARYMGGWCAIGTEDVSEFSFYETDIDYGFDVTSLGLQHYRYTCHFTTMRPFTAGRRDFWIEHDTTKAIHSPAPEFVRYVQRWPDVVPVLASGRVVTMLMPVTQRVDAVATPYGEHYPQPHLYRFDFNQARGVDEFPDPEPFSLGFLPNPSWVREWGMPRACAVGNGRAFAILSSLWTFQGIENPCPPIVTMMTTDDGGATWGHMDITDAILDEWMMTLLFSGESPFSDYGVPNATGSYSGSVAGGRAAIVNWAIHLLLARSCFVPISGHRALWIFSYPKSLVMAGGQSYGIKIVRLSSSGAEAVLDEEDFFDGEIGKSPRHFDGPAYLGEGRVLVAKWEAWTTAANQDAYGYEFDVTFMFSADDGASWASVTPTGLPSLKHNRIGRVCVLRPYVDEDNQGLIAITAFEADAMKYALYTSKDCGATWKRAATVARTGEFARMNPEYAAERQDGFGDLDYCGKQTWPVSPYPAIPGFLASEA